uniref:Glycosyltransferase subfamily 4-like N-terminal domain-containing protein n=1 Tax=Pseudo-nitzschia australis TaxID=44445 RepID=A0A7S4A9X8_9STRA|mmetsp:Transcript_2293/g.4919  ORF Transcript_2293/g.4919 Transcript_2293/m.4919 type:complete len:476 (-) Transcript_2293:120-1547(-)
MEETKLTEKRSLHIIVIVLGDLGRSPRMQYHANSLLKEGHSVSLVGYDGEDLIPELQESTDDRLNVVRFSVPSPAIIRKSLPIYLVWRVVSLCLYLLYALTVSVPKGLSKMKRVDGVLVQNPPAMPLLAIVYLYCSLTAMAKGYRPAFIIDWHNLGFTMLSKSSLVFANIARIYERTMAPLATSHLCVTDAMKTFIEKQFGINACKIHVTHDCPASMFYPRTAKDNHELMAKLHGKLCAGCPRSWYQHLDPPYQTLFTEKISNDEKNEIDNYAARKGRPALITSSTSWTVDEDFGVLLKALVRLDGTISELDSSLKVVVVVTGKGPQKGFYQKEISVLELKNIAILTLWLEPADYPRLLACADVGISLHTSTSGIDLPMKILDNFGCEVPVCAYNFPCLKELVEDDVNGRTFESISDLHDQLLCLLNPLDKYPGSWPPHGFGDLARYSRKLMGRKKWDENWKENALPAIQLAVPP